VCRKTGICDFVSGIVAGVMSVFWVKNVEAVSRCGFSKKDCEIVCNDKFESKYIPAMPLISCGAVDFRSLDLYLKDKDFKSFRDLIRFKKILVGNDGKLRFFGKTIMAVPDEFMEIVTRHYEESGLEDILKKSGADSAKVIFSEIFGSLSVEKKISAFISLHTALGWGIPFLKKDGKRIEGGSNPSSNALW